MKKKLLSVILCISMLLSLSVPVYVSADATAEIAELPQPDRVGDYIYTQNFEGDTSELVTSNTTSFSIASEDSNNFITKTDTAVNTYFRIGETAGTTASEKTAYDVKSGKCYAYEFDIKLLNKDVGAGINIALFNSTKSTYHDFMSIAYDDRKSTDSYSVYSGGYAYHRSESKVPLGYIPTGKSGWTNCRIEFGYGQYNTYGKKSIRYRIFIDNNAICDTTTFTGGSGNVCDAFANDFKFTSTQKNSKSGTPQKFSVDNIKFYEISALTAAPVTSISTSYTGETEQFADSLSEVTFTAKGNMTITDPENIKWYVNDELQAETGATFAYTPPANVGNYNVYAEYNGLKSDTTTIIVNEIEVLDTVTVTSSGETEQLADNISTVTFTAAGNIEIASPESIKWYVNGELQAETGATFAYTPPSETGAYAITAEYDSIISNSVAVTVIGYRDDPTEDTYIETQNVFSHNFTSPPGLSAGDPYRFNQVYPQTYGTIVDPLDETNKAMYITSTTMNKMWIGPDKDVLFSADYYLPEPAEDASGTIKGSILFSKKTLATFTYDYDNKNYVISAGGTDLGTVNPNEWFTANFNIYRSENDDLTLAWKYAKVYASFTGKFKNAKNADVSYMSNTFSSAVTYDSSTWGKSGSPALGLSASNGTIYVDNYSITYPATLTVSAVTPETYGEGYGMKLNGKLYISFNRDIDFDTVSSESIIIKDSEGNTLNPEFYGDSSKADTIVADFKNAPALSEYSTYSIEITDGLKDVTGRHLLEKAFSFETQYDPSDEAFLKTLGFKAADSEDVTAVAGFSSSIDTDTAYNVSVDSAVTSLTLIAEPVNKACTVTLSPADGIVDLSSGSASASVTITSPDGTKTVVHTVNFSAYSGILTTSIKILPISLTLPLDFDYEAKLKTIVLPEDATNTALIFTSSDNTVATVDENGCITPVGIGNCTITASAADNGGAYAQIPVTIIAANNYTGKNLLNLPSTSVARIDKAKYLSLPETLGSGQIALWYNDTKAVWTHSADDSIIGDFDDWQDIYEQTGLPTTLFVPAGKHDQTAVGKTHHEMWVWAEEQTGLDIGSHTYTHGDFTKMSTAQLAWDYYTGVETISNYTNKKVPVVAYASGDAGDVNIAAKYHIAARGVYGSQNSSDKTNYMYLNSISGCGDIAANIEKAIANNNWYCTHYHSLTDKETFLSKVQTYATPRIEDGTLWAATIEDAAMYGQERDTAVLDIKEFTENQIKYELTDSMCDDYFYFPLTVKFYVPNNWISVSAEQNGSAAAAELKTIDGKKYVFVNAVPDRGDVVVTAVLGTSDASDITVSASGGSITASINGGEAQDWGSLKTDSFETGDNITITASPAQEDSSFMYWKDSDSGLILSYNEAYSFTVGSKRNISAVYTESGNVYVTFKNANGRIVSAEFVGADSKVPENPYLYGYDFEGWYKNGTKTTLVAGDAIADTETTIYSAGFTKSETTYTVTVNGTESSYQYNDKVSLTADEQDNEGKFFNYWMRDGKIVSYSTSYSFFVSGNTTVTAVYGDTSVSEEIVLVMSDPIIVDSSKIAFFAERSLPETCTVIEAGILIGTEAGLDIETAPIKAISKDTKNNGQFTVRKANAASGITYYGRAYVIYSDADGVHTIYSDEVSKAI